MRLNALNVAVCALTLAAPAACGTETTPTGPDLSGGSVAIDVAPLTLEGVGNAEWRIVVTNNVPETVWDETIDADGYGDGRGAVSYIGPCDAQATPNTVSLTLVALYDEDGAELTDYVNPGTLTRTATCTENADAPITFEVALMRQANQGFFDIAVDLEDVFCSAKVDCETPDGADNDLLFNGDARDLTAVMALACTSGPGTDTVLHWNDVTLDCDDADYVIDMSPADGDGNQGAIAPYVFDHAIYFGSDELTVDGAPSRTRYWNLAVGLDEEALAGHSCAIVARATVTDGNPGATIGGDSVYPFIDVNVDLWDATDGRVCERHPLGSADVATAYAGTDDEPEVTFTHHYDGATVGEHAAETEIRFLHTVAQQTLDGAHPDTTMTVVLRTSPDFPFEAVPVATTPPAGIELVSVTEIARDCDTGKTPFVDGCDVDFEYVFELVDANPPCEFTGDYELEFDFQCGAGLPASDCDHFDPSYPNETFTLALVTSNICN